MVATAVEIGPQENRDRHVKTYVEASVEDAIKEHRDECGFYSISEAVRDLILTGLKFRYK